MEFNIRSTRHNPDERMILSFDKMEMPAEEQQAPVEEPGPSVQTAPPAEPPRKGKKLFGRILMIILLLLLGGLLYWLASVFLTADRNVQQVYLIPKDAAFIIQCSEPVRDWEHFSQSEPWKALKRAPAFAEITESAESLDSIIRGNKVLLSLVGKRDMMISMHKTSTTLRDFLIVVDLQKVSKMETLKGQVEQILKIAGGTVTQRKYKDVVILEMRDSDTGDILYMSFVDNHMVASYSSRLVEASVDERENPQIGLEHGFIEAERLVMNKGLCRIFINYAYLPQFLGIYLGESNEYIDRFSGSMDFAGLWFDADRSKMEVNGYTLLKEEADPYITALLRSGSHKMKAHEIMSSRTALYTNIGFSDPVTFVKELEAALSGSHKQMYDSYTKTRGQLEKYFGISLEKNFLGWMSGEFALAQSEPGLLGREPEMILAVRAKNIKDARESMDLIGKRIKNRTPIKIRSVEYKGYEINYIEMKGFFRLFFGGLMDKFEKPYYTFVDDYMVLSNTSASLLSFIEDYEQKNTLRNNDVFKKSLSRAGNNSTLFVYADMHKFYPLLKGMLNGETWNDISINRDVLYSFPGWSLQVVGGKQVATMRFAMDYEPFTKEALTSALAVSDDVDAEDKALDEDAESEKELMNELKRFYVEKFEGNVLREFYDGGFLKSESETKEGKRHGRYREYYEDGTLHLRGKYANNKPKGTWKYYSPEGKFDHKEKF